MIKSRIIWILWLLLTGILWLRSESYAAFVLLLASAAVPVLAILLTRGIAGKLEISVMADVSGLKNEEFQAALLVRNKGRLPFDGIRAELKLTNILTGETSVSTFFAGAFGKSEGRKSLLLSSSHCGTVVLEIIRAEAFDPFRLSGHALKIGGTAEVIVQPSLYETSMEIIYGESLSLDSDMYSMKKAGFDPSETFAIREYRPGDRMRQIHWKLTEKFGEPLVREYGLPIQNTILLVFETGFDVEEDAPSGDVTDALCSGFLSSSGYMASAGIVHSLAVYDHREGTLFVREISDETELLSRYPVILRASAGKDTLSVMGHYMSGHEQCDFAHIVVFTHRHLPDLASLADRSLITEIVCEEEEKGLYMEGAVRVCSASPKKMPEALSYLEI